MNTRACAHREPTRLVHLAALLAAALCLVCAPAQSRTTCRDTVLGTFCTSEVDFAAFAQQAYQTQQASQWCWAASISMLFAYHGHPVSQARIVSEAYGSPINMPAQGYVMAQQLNRRWIDDNGRAFTARVSGLYDAWYGIYGVTNEQLVAELDRDRPVIFGNQSHAVVLTQLQYYRTPLGPNVVAGGVFDPWPGIGARPLTPQEMVAGALGGAMMFVATAALTSETATPAPPSAQPGNDTDTGGSGSLDLIVILFLGLTIAGSRRWRRGS